MQSDRELTQQDLLGSRNNTNPTKRVTIYSYHSSTDSQREHNRINNNNKQNNHPSNKMG